MREGAGAGSTTEASSDKEAVLVGFTLRLDASTSLIGLEEKPAKDIRFCPFFSWSVAEEELLLSREESLNFPMLVIYRVSLVKWEGERRVREVAIVTGNISRINRQSSE